MELTLSVSLSRADKVRSPYSYVPFDVPEGTTRIDIAMHYAKAEDCIVDLGLFDTGFAPFPAETGFRGWSGGARDRFFVATDDATPGYLPGPVPAGRWFVILGLYRLPDSPVSVSLDIAFDNAPRGLASPPPVSTAKRSGSGWYRGDLHSHCYHSDAQGSPELLHASARQSGLDFLGVADHNTISQRRYFNAASTPELVFVRAMEVTTEFGHANVFGLDEWVDFRFEANDDALKMASIVRDKGGLLSINHDKPPIAWHWARPAADCMEVWQSTWPALNTISLGRYQDLLSSGARLTAIGGSDYHQPATLEADGPLSLGRPTTAVWVEEELSEASILAAMRMGRTYVTESPSGPSIEFALGNARMGDTGTIGHALTVSVGGAAGDRLDIIDAGGILASIALEGDTVELELALAEASRFVRAEVVAVASRPRLEADNSGFLRDNAEELAGMEMGPWRRVISSPIYLKSRR